MNIQQLLSPSTRFALKKARTAWRLQVARARLWDWEIVNLAAKSGAPYQVFYAGTKQNRARVSPLLGLDRESGAEGAAPEAPALPVIEALPAAFSPNTVLVSEAPLPGALRMPWGIHTIVPLGRTVDEILATYDGELRRRLRKQRGEYRFRQVVDDAEIAEVSRTMLEPYAAARHGSATQQLDREVVRKMAQGSGEGRLDLVLKGEEAVGCHLGYGLTWNGKRYWITLRFGYPEAVFSEQKRLRDINSINTFLALEWALGNGFDFYDIGAAIARPDDGLLQWKRRRGGAPDLLHNDGFFFVRLPRAGAAQFLWDAPLFAAGEGKLTLRLGLPLGPTDDEAIKRYREMGYGGITRIYLYCARPPGDRLLESLRGLYGQSGAPPIEAITVS
jgi:hypothetical protein